MEVEGRIWVKGKGKNIVSSELGRQLYSVAPEILTSVDLTALWFEEQKRDKCWNKKQR